MTETIEHMNVLLVEDSKQVADVIYEYFEDTEIELDYAATGTRGLTLAQQNSYQCIILDIMLPGIDGLTLCKTLRDAGNNCPIIMLTARDTNQDMLEGLNIGADDYIVKPFDLELLEARITAVVRRSSGLGFKNSLTVGELSIDLKSHCVTRQGKRVSLNPSGFKILKLLCEHHPNLVTREAIESVLWPDELPDQDILRKHIYQLRSKIDKPFDREMIITVPKQGYKIEQ
ncbi:response regulator transcription factor [Thalassotalea atypica]|uniref:response regulator transcription factor n=1 Tax=Thalassotalea atypica TaxID=2054316 RepID=UPI0025729CBC|nr:response regulator transcription factor [Thalassotalea atypica]